MSSAQLNQTGALEASFTYTPAMALSTATGPNAVTTTIEYDGVSQPTVVTTEFGAKVTYDYSGVGATAAGKPHICDRADYPFPVVHTSSGGAQTALCSAICSRQREGLVCSSNRGITSTSFPSPKIENQFIGEVWWQQHPIR